MNVFKKYPKNKQVQLLKLADEGQIFSLVEPIYNCAYRVVSVTPDNLKLLQSKKNCLKKLIAPSTSLAKRRSILQRGTGIVNNILAEAEKHWKQHLNKPCSRKPSQTETEQATLKDSKADGPDNLGSPGSQQRSGA